MKNVPHIVRLWVAGIAVGLAGVAVADDRCGDPFANQVGPYDYRDPSVHVPGQLVTVEKYHFNSDVRFLRKGQSSKYVLDDLDYVLRACPNHHLALHSMSNLFLRGMERERDRFSPYCYFDRAMRYSPADGTVRMLYGIHLARAGDNDGALRRYREALDRDLRSPELHYNLGLLLAEMGQHTLANRHAVTAYGMGYPLQGLKRKLVRLGAWDPDAQPYGDAEEGES